MALPLGVMARFLPSWGVKYFLSVSVFPCIYEYLIFMLEMKMQASIFCYCTGKIEDILETLEEFKPQSCSNLSIYVNQYAFLQTIFQLSFFG